MSRHSFTVEGCRDCPFCAEQAFCQHPLRESMSIYGDDWHDVFADHPTWCPLQKADAVVMLRKK